MHDQAKMIAGMIAGMNEKMVLYYDLIIFSFHERFQKRVRWKIGTA
jgi:hypothetical protein